VSAFDAAAVRREFPILAQSVRGRPLVYLDSAATTQKPRAVLEALRRYYEEDNANVHRAVHLLSERATLAYEAAREKVFRFLNASSTKEIVFVRGTTEAVNLVANTFGRTRVGAGDEVLVTHLEHHSNIVPWQMLCREKGAALRVVPVNDAGELDLEALDRLLGPRTRILALGHVSNALGTVNPIRRIVDLARAKGVPVLVDGAQAVPHLKVDVQALGCDFYAFSGHKVYGPTGIGALWARTEHLEAMPPWQGGGDMISSVRFEETLYNVPPARFEAGTPNIAGAVGLGAAIDWLQALGLDRVEAHEKALLGKGTELLSAIPGLTLIGTAKEKAGVLSFIMEGIHPHDIGTVLDRQGIAIRTGHHCAQPVMERFGIPATARASLGVYNTGADLEALAAGLRKVREMFA